MTEDDKLRPEESETGAENLQDAEDAQVDAASDDVEEEAEKSPEERIAELATALEVEKKETAVKTTAVKTTAVKTAAASGRWNAIWPTVWPDTSRTWTA